MKSSLNASSRRMVPVTFWVQVIHFMVFKEYSTAHQISDRPVIQNRVGDDREGELQCSKLLRRKTEYLWISLLARLINELLAWCALLTWPTSVQWTGCELSWNSSSHSDQGGQKHKTIKFIFDDIVKLSFAKTGEWGKKKQNTKTLAFSLERKVQSSVFILKDVPLKHIKLHWWWNTKAPSSLLQCCWK